MIGSELISYGESHGIKSPVVERKRCWRIDYADDLNFHIDNLPCLPEETVVIEQLTALGVPQHLAQTSIGLTCKDDEQYRVITSAWPMSNPNGYAVWFEQRFGTVGNNRRKNLVESGLYKAASEVPIYELKTPLQSAIQILKRHRDFMFQSRPELKPISIIITTLAGQAYDGEDNLLDTVTAVLDRMARSIRSGKPRIPNPVNPGEDFADKWSANPALEQNFWLWYAKAQHDFNALKNTEQKTEVQKLTESRFGIRPPVENKTVPIASLARRISPAVVVQTGPKPWGYA